MEQSSRVTNIKSEVIKRDFKWARNYLTLLEDAEAEWEAKSNKTAQERGRQKSIHSAFSLAAVVAYMRPFTTGHRPIVRENEPWINGADILVKLDSRPDLKKLHVEYSELRHNTLAHTAEKSFEPHLIKSIARKSIPKFRELIDEVERLVKDKNGAQK